MPLVSAFSRRLPVPLMHRQILYLSHLAPPGGLGGFRLADIAQQAATRNQLIGIRAVLLFDGYRFCHLFEGTDEETVGLLARLRADPRHQGLRVLSDRLLCECEITPAYVLGPLVSGHCDALEFDVFEGDCPPTGAAALTHFTQILRRADLQP